jgi:transcription antitermination factor NusG
VNLNAYRNRWLALQVRPKHELVTARILSSKGYDEFVPMGVSIRRWSDRQKELVLPLFTGYVFCRFREDVRWPLLTTPGAIRLVKDGTGIATIDDEEIATIRLLEQLHLRVHGCAYPKIGERVRVTDGPLAGVEGLMVRHKGDGRLVLSVDAIQRCFALEIDGFQVVAVSDQAAAHCGFGHGSADAHM